MSKRCNFFVVWTVKIFSTDHAGDPLANLHLVEVTGHRQHLDWISAVLLDYTADTGSRICTVKQKDFIEVIWMVFSFNLQSQIPPGTRIWKWRTSAYRRTKVGAFGVGTNLFIYLFVCIRLNGGRSVCKKTILSKNLQNLMLRLP